MAQDPHHDESTKSITRLPAGGTVGHYRVVDYVGGGGMGEVYRADDTVLGRTVALKFLSPTLVRNDEARGRFLREAQAVAALSHPSIIHIYEIGEQDGRPWLALEFIDGRPLKDVIRLEDTPLEQVYELAVQIIDGLAAAHEAGIVHRDIKPANILIDKKQRAHIVDFGLASVCEATQLTRSGTTMGTVGYMSPEQAQGCPTDARSDLFSFGVVLYELITRKNPFHKDSDAATLAAICHEQPEPLARFKREVPLELQQIVDKLLEKDPALRYQHASDVLVDLKRLIKHSTGEHPSYVMPPKKKSTLPLVIGAIVLAVAALAAVKIFFADKPALQTVRRQITFDGDVAMCVISPDGQFVAYVRQPGGFRTRGDSILSRDTLWVQDIASQARAPLFDAPSIDEFSWSPDSRQIAAAGAYKFGVTDVVTELFTAIIPRIGGKAKFLGPPHFIGLAWLPDAQHVSCCRPSTKQVFIQSLTDRKVDTVRARIAGDYMRFWGWSSSGAWFLASTSTGEGSTLWVVSADGLFSDTLLTGDLYTASISANGRSIYCLRANGPTYDLLRLPVNPRSGSRTGDIKTIQSGISVPSARTWRIAQPIPTSRGDQVALNGSSCIEQLGIFVQTSQAKPAYTEFRVVSTTTSGHGDAALSSDGRQIAFYKVAGAQQELFTMSASGGDPVQRTFTGTGSGNPGWSPDGSAIAYCALDSGEYVIAVLNLRTGISRVLDSAHVGAYNSITWPTASEIYYRTPNGRNYMIIGAASGAIRPLITNDSVGWIFNPVVSPDERKVAVFWNRLYPSLSAPDARVEEGLYIIDKLTGHQERANARREFPLRWLPDGKNLLCLGIDFRNLVKIGYLSGECDTLFSSGDQQDLSILDVSADGRVILATAQRYQNDVWLFENFDPYVK